MTNFNGRDSHRYVAAITIIAASLVTAGPVLNKPVRAQAFIAGRSTATPVMAECIPARSIAGRMRMAPSDNPAHDVVRARSAEFDACLSMHLHCRLVGAEAGDDKTPWTPGDIVSAEDLAKVISSSRGVKPVILQVGIEGLYREAHIPDAIFAGPAAEPEGLNLLKSKVKTIAHTREIVIYCGCCPWKDCPNIRPAFVALQQMGFKKVKLLNIPTDFHQDWINKGFPTMRS